MSERRIVQGNYWVYQRANRQRRISERLNAVKRPFTTHFPGAASIARTSGVGLIAHASHAIVAGVRNPHNRCPHVAHDGVSEHGAPKHRVVPRPSAKRAAVCETVRGPPS